jgi:hypothetical protein
MNKKFIVKLDAEERATLQAMLTTGKPAANKILHARILLKADAGEGGPNWSDAEIAEALETSPATVQRTRQRLVEEGFQAALCRKKSTRQFIPALDGEAEAHMVALSCSTPPAGRQRWTVRLLTSRMVELGYVGSIGRETIRKTLKKTNCSPG